MTLNKADLLGTLASSCTVSGVTFPATIVPGASATLDITFTPLQSGTLNSTLQLSSNDPNTPKKSVVLAAEVPFPSYTVTPVAGTGGSMNPTTPQSITANSTTIFSITASSGYSLLSVSGCGGTLVGTTYTTGVITAACDVTATFSPLPGTGVCGTSNGGTFTTAPTTNLCTTGTASTVSGSSPWNWTCSGTNGGTNATCSAGIMNFSLIFAAGPKGSLNGTDRQTINYGGNTSSITAVPATGYQFVNWTGTGGFVTSSANPLTVTNVTSAQTITANFSDNTFTVTPTAGSNGTISPAAPQAVNTGATTSFTVTPSSGYQIATVTGCGGTLSNTTYTTGVITGACTVSASFSVIPPSTTLKGDVNGDGKVDIFDALLTLQYGLNLIPHNAANDANYLANADVAPLDTNGKPKGDGKIDIFDALIILQAAVNLIQLN
jgi:uncharacterized repeat protein (TIGR02543 family)